MAHTPRRERDREPPPVVLTDAQIAEAMQRAYALRLRSAVDPDWVVSQAMDAHDAMSHTRNYRYHSHWYQMKHWDGRDDDPWWWIGWISEDPGGTLERKRTWWVWMNVDDGRVHLRFERPWGWGQDDDCPYP